MKEIGPGLAIIPTLIANAYLAGDRDSWVLVDALTPGNENRIRRAAEKRFGRGCRPQAILLTHGHFDRARFGRPPGRRLERPDLRPLVGAAVSHW